MATQQQRKCGPCGFFSSRGAASRTAVLSAGLIFLLTLRVCESLLLVAVGETRAERTTDSEARWSEVSFSADALYRRKNEPSRSLLPESSPGITPSSSGSFPTFRAIPSSLESSPKTPSPSTSSPSTTSTQSNSFTPPSLDSSQGSSAGARLILLIALPIVSVTAVALVAGVLFVVCRRRKDDKASQPSPCKTGVPLTHEASSAKPFRLRELQRCTNNFDSRYRIGERGASGAVYRGQIGGSDKAIKVMAETLTASELQRFLLDVNFLSRLPHTNLIQIVGYCNEGSKRIVVYPYYPGGSLHDRLHKRCEIHDEAPIPPLTLLERMSIALQIAEALRYLHSDADPHVIHGSVKSCNVLLSGGAEDNLRAVVTDFGLGLPIVAETVLDPRFTGTAGYLAPEYLTRGKWSKTSDVYSFGLILLELLTGKPAIRPTSGPRREFLHCWVEQFYTQNSSGLMQSFVDPCLRYEVGSSTALTSTVVRATSLAMECSTMDARERPEIINVVDRMREIVSEVREARLDTSGNGS
ncbi:hypothetical protein CBR_g58073 [Chara braunii]|uniref:Protein kinase domain-containing protein n=1 Tax=Chara braunii TaxID=69332 RepID=A0A388MEJ2_CHABU|nr:hypothetical protein CBR_g58073 [Chara braunii]|eukprot:GBG92988.1 hypothetical protein CBR_g58073 [Chara braunii]